MAEESIVVPSSFFDGTEDKVVMIKVETSNDNAFENDRYFAMATLFAIEQEAPCQILFDYDQPGYTKVQKYLAKGSNLILPEAPIVSGYRFIGWYHNDMRYDESTLVSGNLVLKAKYEEIETIIVDDAGSTKPNVTTPGPNETINVGQESKNDATKEATQETTKEITNAYKLPKKGSKTTIKGITYQVTKSSKTSGTVKVSKIQNKKLKNLTIPAKITINGYNFKVVEIANGVCKKATKLTKVTIGANVTTIGKDVFNGCKSLKTIQIYSAKLKRIGKNAFKNLAKKVTIQVPAKKLKTYEKLLKGKVNNTIKYKKK